MNSEELFKEDICQNPKQGSEEQKEQPVPVNLSVDGAEHGSAVCVATDNVHKKTPRD